MQSEHEYKLYDINDCDCNKPIAHDNRFVRWRCNSNDDEIRKRDDCLFKDCFPADMHDFIQLLLDTSVRSNSTVLSSNGARFDPMSQNTGSDYYVRICDAILTYYSRNGRHDIDAYKPIFDWQFNRLYIRPNLVTRVCNPNYIATVDNLLDHEWSALAIQQVINVYVKHNLTKELPKQYMNMVIDYVNESYTSEYDHFIEVLVDLQRCYYDGVNVVDIDNVAFSYINFLFAAVLVSVGNTIFDFESAMYNTFVNQYPFTRALSMLEIAESQGSVSDMGYIDLLTRSVKSTIDFPHTLHTTCRSISDSTTSMAFCADRMAALTGGITEFITKFMDRTSNLANDLSKDVLINIVEVFLDFISDLPNLAAVPMMRWITYISRVLRIFLPDCMSLAFNIFNTYVASVFSAVAQGFDDLIQMLVVVITGTIALRSVPERAHVNSMLEYMKVVNLSIPFSKNITAMLTCCFKALPEMVQAWAKRFVPEYVFYQNLISTYGDVINGVDRFLTYDIDKIYFDKNLSKEFVSLYTKAHDLVRDMAPFARDNSGEFTLLREQLRKFDKMYESYCSITKCGVIRECPFSLTIAGTSQIGKSTLSSAVARFMFPDHPADRVRYVIPTDPDEFWSGYSPLHAVTAEDDADQDAEYKNALQLFSIVTNAPYQPPMASVDDRSIGVKGTPYHSKMHIRCTNNPYPNPNTKVLTVEAYWKRRHMLVWAEVKPDYIINGKIQYCPLFKHLCFYDMNPIDPNSEKVLIGDLSEFLVLLRNRYNSHVFNEERVIRMMSIDGVSFLSDLASAYNCTTLLPDAQGSLSDTITKVWHESVIVATGTLQKLKDYVKTNSSVARVLKLTALVAAVATASVTMLTLYKSMYPTVDAEAIPSGDAKTMRFRKNKRPAYAEGTSDPSAESLVQEVVRGRQAYVEIYDRRTEKRNHMCGLFIGGQYILLPYHLFIAADGMLVTENSRMVINTDQAKFEQMFEPSRLTRLTTKDGVEKDTAVYLCTLQVRAFKDIRHHFVHENDLAYIPNYNDAALIKFNTGLYERQLVKVTSVTNQKYVVTGVATPYTLYKGYAYDAITVSGDCGSALLLYNTRITGKILGIHVAGERSKHRGFSDLVTAEMLSQFNPRVQPRTRPATIDDKPAVIFPEGNYTYYGTVPPEQAVYPVTRTEIKPSLIQGMITTPVTKPVDMDRRCFAETISRFFEPSMPINPQVKNALLNDAKDLVDCMYSFKLGVIDEYTAINGNPKYEFFERMNMHTSPGLPYKKIKPGKGKFGFFRQDDEGNYIVDHPHLRKAIDERLAMARKGLAYDSMWMDIPKDERRKPEKHVRMIVTPPLDYQIVFRMYFMDYIIAFYGNKLHDHSAVGINPYSMDWTELMDKLKANSDVGGDGDHTAFDGHLLTDFLDIEIQAINHYYRYETDHDEASRVREVLWYEIVHTPTQCVNVAYCVHCGMPSGCNCTTIINTNCNDRYYKLAWLGLAPLELRDLRHFYNNVRVFAYGDDSIVSIKREVLDWYNFAAIGEHLSLYNIKFTMADKKGEIIPFKPLEECTFLKNGFRREGNIYHAMMDTTTLYEMVNWIRESDDDYYATLANANCALMMWYHYGPERFAYERSRLHSALVEAGRKCNNTPHLYSYDYLDEVFRTDRPMIRQGEDLANYTNIDDVLGEYHSPPIEEAAATTIASKLKGLLWKQPVTAVAQGGVEPSTSHGTAGEADESNTKEETNVAEAVTFIEQKPAVEVDRSVALNHDDQLMFGAWSLKRFFSKPVRIGTYNWATTNGQGDVLKIISLPDIFYKLPVWSNFVNSFTFMKWKPTLRVQINGNKFTAGRLLLYGVPFSYFNVASSSIWDPANLNYPGYTGFDHVFLDASSNDVVTLTLPWIYPKRWFNIATYTGSVNAGTANRYNHTASSAYNSGWVHNYRLMVLNKLQVGTGAATSVNVTIFLHLDDVDICVPTIATSSAQGGSQSYVTQNINNWEKVASQTLPTQIVGDKYDFKSDLKVSTMDKPNFTLSPDYFVRRAMGYFSHGVNYEHLERLCLYPNGVSTGTYDDFGTMYDEMSLSYLTSRYTYFGTYSVTTAQTASTAVLTLPVTPYILPTVGTTTKPQLATLNPNNWSPPAAKHNIPLLSYVSMPFNFWGGSIKYRFDFITNAFVTGKYYLSIVYGTNVPEITSAGVEPTSALGYTFEVNADNKTFEVDIPYVADTPWKRVMRSQFLNATGGNISTNADDMVGDQCTIAEITLWVLNPLSQPSGLPTSYDLNVFIAGGPDFRLNFISRANTAWIPVAQTNIDPNPGTDLSMLGQELYRTDMAVMSEQYTSVRDVLKRYTHVWTTLLKIDAFDGTTDTAYTSVSIVPIASLLTPFFSSDAANISGASNMINWFLALYRVWRGSLRVKVQFEIQYETDPPPRVPLISADFYPDNINASDAVRLAAMGANNESAGPTSLLQSSPTRKTWANTTHHGPRTVGNDTAPFVEFEVPFVYPNRVAPVPLTGLDGTCNWDLTTTITRNKSFANNVNTFGNVVINYPRLIQPYIATSRIFLAVGDDFRAGCLMGPPQIGYAGIITVPADTSQRAVPPDFYN